MQQDFNKLSENELEHVIEDARRALKQKQENKRRQVITQIKELAASIDVGVEITEPGPKKGSRKGIKVPAKYRNPNNLSDTWSGRGMKPNWLKSLLEKGHRLEEFRIKS